MGAAAVACIVAHSPPQLLSPDPVCAVPRAPTHSTPATWSATPAARATTTTSLAPTATQRLLGPTPTAPARSSSHPGRPRCVWGVGCADGAGGGRQAGVLQTSGRRFLASARWLCHQFPVRPSVLRCVPRAAARHRPAPGRCTVAPPPPPPSLAATPSPPPNDSLFRSHVRLVNGPSPCSPKGTFNSDTAGDSCMPCAAGRFSPTLGSKECKVRQGRVGRAAAHARACGGAPSRRPPIGRQLCAGPDPPGSVPHLLEASFMIGWRPPLVLRRPAPLAPTPRLSPRAASIAAPATLPRPAALRATPGEAGAARGGVVLGKQACNPW